MTTKSVHIGYHGHCFDGMASAAILSRFFRERNGSAIPLTTLGLDHQPGGSFVPEESLTGHENVVADFRYSTSPKLTWWFDHHVSGVANDEERASLRTRPANRFFYDPTYSSCAKFIMDRLQEVHSWNTSELDELVHWADLIDAARFPSAQAAVALEEAPLQLMSVLEFHGTSAFLTPRIEALSKGHSLLEVASDAEVKRLFAPISENHARAHDAIAKSARLEGGVVEVDITGLGSDRYNKFIPYALFPSALYAVVVSAGKARAKVSVGTNPWTDQLREHNIAALCAEFGGGGHPMVGAVSLAADQVERARTVGKTIAQRLRS